MAEGRIVAGWRLAGGCAIMDRKASQQHIGGAEDTMPWESTNAPLTLFLFLSQVKWFRAVGEAGLYKHLAFPRDDVFAPCMLCV